MARGATHSGSGRRVADLGERIGRLEAEYKADPGNKADELAEAYLEDGRPRDALRLLDMQKGDRGKGALRVGRAILVARAHFDLFENGKAAHVLRKAAGNGVLERDPWAQLILGELAFENEQDDDAKKHFRTVLQLDTGNRRAAQMLINLGEDVEPPEGDSAGAPSLFRTDEPAPESAGRALAHLGIGLAVCVGLLALYVWWAGRAHEVKVLVSEAAPMLVSGDVATLRAAEAKYKDALEIMSSDAYVISGLAEVYAQLWVDHGVDGARDAAISYTEQARDGGIEKAERFSAELLVAYGQGQYEVAEKLAADIIERGGVSEKIYFALGLAQRANGKTKGGRDNLRRAQDLRAGAPHYARALGDAYDEDNDARNAAVFWEQAFKANSSYVAGEARHLMAQIRKGDDSKKTKRALDRLAGLPQDRTGRLDRAAIRLAQATWAHREGNSKKALALVNQAIEFAGETPRLLAMRGQLLVAGRKIDNGLATLKQAHEKNPALARYFYLLAAAQTKYGSAKEGLKVLLSGAERYAATPGYHTALGDAYRARQKPSEAKKAYEEALALRKSDADALLGMGTLCWQEKKYEDAANWFEKAVNARSSFPEVYEAVGLMWIEQGASQQANKQLQLAELAFKRAGTNAIRMTAFYRAVIKAFAKARGTSAYVKFWVEKEKKYRSR